MAKSESAKVEFLCVLDFEATCEEDPKPRPNPQEIIEFPSVLLRKVDEHDTFEVMDSFESFVRPIIHPKLSSFCTALTTITQEQVETAETFPEVLTRHVDWLRGHGCFEETATFQFVTCGDWDFKTVFPMQMAASNISFRSIPKCYSRWINIKRVYDSCTGRRSRGMASMLDSLKIQLTGTHHRGIDDCRNIAKILLALDERYVPDFSKPTGGYRSKE